jgi:hypothetical protein
VLVALVMALSMVAYADDSTGLVISESGSVEIDYQVNGENLAWHRVYDTLVDDDHPVVYMAGNSYSDEGNVSNISLTVTGKGTLTFDYCLESADKDGSIYQNYTKPYGMFYSSAAAITSTNWSEADNYKGKSNWLDDFVVKSGWGTVTIPISSTGTTTVYVAYYRNGKLSTGTDYVAISNVCFTSDLKTLTVENTNSTYGSVAVKEGENALNPASSYAITPNADVTLTAITAENGQFYGWVEDGKLLSTETTYKTTLTASRTIQAVFAKAGTYTARLNGTFYDGENGLTTALSAAKSSDTVVMLKDQTLSSNAEVKAGVTLVLACMDNDPGYVTTSEGFQFNPSSEKNSYGDNTLYATLTINSDATLTVNGTVMVNAVTGILAGGGYDQNLISGGYAVIDLKGSITVKSGGTLENFGQITGSGTVTAESGASIGDRYEIHHYRGGSYLTSAYNYTYPLLESGCYGIESTVVVKSGASLYGLVKMYESAFLTYHHTRFPQIDNTNGLIRLSDGATLTRTYADKRFTLTIDGGAAFDGSALTLVLLNSEFPLTTKDYVYPVNGDHSFVLKNGDYAVNESFKLMPGATVDVMGDASVTVAADKTLVAYSGYTDSYVTESLRYPSDYDDASITLHGGATMTVKGSFGGNVLTEDCTTTSPATLDLSSAQAYRNVATVEMANASTTTTVTTNTVLEGVATVVKKTYTNDGTGWAFAQSAQIYGDANQDGKVTLNDIDAILANLGKTGTDVYGDANQDGKVTLNDIDAVLANLGRTNS